MRRQPAGWRRRRGGRTGVTFRRTDHPGAPASIKLSRHPSARRGIWFPYVLGASPSVISISVPQGSVMYTIRRPDAFVLLRIAASVLMPAA